MDLGGVSASFRRVTLQNSMQRKPKGSLAVLLVGGLYSTSFKSCVCRLLDLLVVWTQPLYPDWGHCVRWNGEWFEWLRGWGWYRLNILLFHSSSLCVVQAVWIVSAKVLKRVAWIEPYGSNFFTHALLWWARAVAALVSTHFTFYMFIRSSATYIMHKCKV